VRHSGSRPADPLPRLAGIAVLRRLDVTDLAVFRKYRHDPLIARYQDWYGNRTDAEAVIFLAANEYSRAAATWRCANEATSRLGNVANFKRSLHARVVLSA
jgi:hypothetical protein